MHYTTIDAPRGVKILEDIIEDSTSVLATVLTSPISVRATAVNLAGIPSCVACVLFWVHLFETFDCVYFQRSCNVTNLERVNLLQEQVAATLLDPRNMPDLNCIPPDQHDQGWALLRGMVIAVIDEVKNSDASTDVNDSIEDVIDFLVMASAAAAVNSLDLSSAEIADREIKTWKTLSQGQEFSGRVALRCCASFPLVGSVGEACTCYSCNFSSSRALVFHGG
jgi:hypothetical protein